MKKISVAVAVIINDLDQVLIAKRHQHLHQGGKWEFPGGKIEEGETAQRALEREIKEEVELTVLEATPLMVLEYDYGDKFVSLDTWTVTRFSGTACGAEQQEIRWVERSRLMDYQFPDANQPIVDSLIIKPANTNATY